MLTCKRTPPQRSYGGQTSGSFAWSRVSFSNSEKRMRLLLLQDKAKLGGRPAVPWVGTTTNSKTPRILPSMKTCMKTYRPEAERKWISKKNPTEEDSPGTSWFSARMIIVLTYGSFDTAKGSGVLLSHSRRAPLCTVNR